MEGKYISDEEITNSYKEFKIREIKMNKKCHGFIDIVFPYRENIVDNFIIRDNEKIAFDNWYPEEIYNELCEYINKQIT